MGQVIDMENSDPNKNIREQVEKRKQEMEKWGSGGGGSGGVGSDFVMQCLRANELGDGMLFAALQRGRFIYNKQAGEWMEWQEHYWSRDVMEHSLQACEDLAVRYLQEAEKIDEQIGQAARDGNKDEYRRLEALKKSLHKRVDRLRSTRGRQNTLAFAHTCEEGLGIDGSDMDMNPYLLACQNGVIDLRTGQVRQGRRDDYLSMASPVEWQGIDAECPTWENALLEIMNDKQEMVDFLQRVFGAAILGKNSENAFFVFSGQGRNGKSLVVETLSWILGDLAAPIPSDMLVDQGKNRNSSGPSPDIMSLRGLRLAFAAETDEGCRISTSRVKWLTGDDTLVGRNPHDKYNSTFPATHSLFLLTNNRPHAPADDFAFWERLYLIPFELSFVNREPQGQNERRQDRTLKTKFRQEAPGILAWIVRGCLQYQKLGLAPPPKVKDAVAEYRRDEDLLADWIEERCIMGENYETSSTVLYADFEEWYQANVGKKVPSQRAFGRMLAKKFEKSKKGTISYRGIALRAADPF